MPVSYCKMYTVSLLLYFYLQYTVPFTVFCLVTILSFTVLVLIFFTFTPPPKITTHEHTSLKYSFYLLNILFLEVQIKNLDFNS